jgi:thiopurine S-methyltransferase
MEKEFWKERWSLGQIGFHLGEVNPHLVRQFDRLPLLPASEILVPLAGKSLDLRFFTEEGHHVTAVELSGLAIEAFFEEQGLSATQSNEGSFIRYTTDQIVFLEGDFFELRPANLAPPTLVYDRAALVAMPPSMQDRYVKQLIQLAQGAPIFLVTLDYPPNEMQGPPFPISASRVEALFSQTHAIEALDCRDELEQNPHFKDKGLTRFTESAWLLSPLNQSV